MSSTAPKIKPKTADHSRRPYNRYNIYFILERENLILDKGGSTKWSTATESGEPQLIRNGYENLNLPPLPSRFVHLVVPRGWYVPGQKKKRPHRKTHGVASFREIAQAIATSWKIIDDETLKWCMAVERILKKRHVELTTAAKTANSVESKSPETEKKSIAKPVEGKQEAPISMAAPAHHVEESPNMPGVYTSFPSANQLHMQEALEIANMVIKDFRQQPFATENRDFCWEPSNDSFDPLIEFYNMTKDAPI